MACRRRPVTTNSLLFLRLLRLLYLGLLLLGTGVVPALHAPDSPLGPGHPIGVGGGSSFRSLASDPGRRLIVLGTTCHQHCKDEDRRHDRSPYDLSHAANPVSMSEEDEEKSRDAAIRRLINRPMRTGS